MLFWSVPPHGQKLRGRASLPIESLRIRGSAAPTFFTWGKYTSRDRHAFALRRIHTRPFLHRVLEPRFTAPHQRMRIRDWHYKNSTDPFSIAPCTGAYVSDINQDAAMVTVRGPSSSLQERDKSLLACNLDSECSRLSGTYPEALNSRCAACPRLASSAHYCKALPFRRGSIPSLLHTMLFLLSTSFEVLPLVAIAPIPILWASLFLIAVPFWLGRRRLRRGRPMPNDSFNFSRWISEISLLFTIPPLMLVCGLFFWRRHSFELPHGDVFAIPLLYGLAALHLTLAMWLTWRHHQRRLTTAAVASLSAWWALGALLTASMAATNTWL